MLPMQSVDLAVAEMRFAREQLGMRGGFLRPNPYHGKKMISDPMYEPFWTMAEARDADRRRRPLRGGPPGAPQMLSERLGPLSAEAKHRVLAGGALGFYGLG